METTITLPEWLARASLEQRNEMYLLADTSRRTAWQVAAGVRNMRPAKAAELERATQAIHELDPTLPPVLRTSSCATCAECPYAKRCGA